MRLCENRLVRVVYHASCMSTKKFLSGKLYLILALIS